MLKIIPSFDIFLHFCNQNIILTAVTILKQQELLNL